MIISEIGWNFLGDINLAKKMIDAAVRAGADILNSSFGIQKT